MYYLQTDKIRDAFQIIADTAFDMIALINDIEIQQQNFKPVNLNPGTNRNAEERDEMSNIYLSEGSIFKRSDGRFEARIYLNGKQRTVATTKFRATAAEKLKAAIDKKKSGHRQSASAYTLYSWLDFWQEKYMTPKNYSKGYIGAISSAIKNHIKPNIPDFPLSKADILSVETGIEEIPTARTAKSAYDTLNEAIGKAYKLQIIPHNFMLAIDKPDYEAETGSAFTLTDQKIFLETIRGHELELLFRFELYSGCRPGEVRREKPEHIDWNENRIFIDGTKTKTSKRWIPLFPHLESVLKRLPVGQDYLFPYSARQICKAIREIYERCSFGNKYNQYSLRHTFATRMHEIGIDDISIAAWLGHSSTTTTRKVYIETQSDYQQSLTKLMDKGFSEDDLPL